MTLLFLSCGIRGKHTASGFDLLEEGGGYVFGMFPNCSSAWCNLRVRTGPFDLSCSWVSTQDFQDSCWDTHIFNWMYNSQYLQHVSQSNVLTQYLCILTLMLQKMHVQHLPESSLIGDIIESFYGCLTPSNTVPCHLQFGLGSRLFENHGGWQIEHKYITKVLNKQTKSLLQKWFQKDTLHIFNG